MVFEEPREEVIYFSSHIQNIPHPAWKETADKTAERAEHSELRDLTAAAQPPRLALRAAKLEAFEIADLHIPPGKPRLKARKQRLTGTKGQLLSSLEPGLQYKGFTMLETPCTGCQVPLLAHHLSGLSVSKTCVSGVAAKTVPLVLGHFLKAPL